MDPKEVAIRIVSAVVYRDPKIGDYVAVVRTDRGMKIEARKNETSQMALSSAIKGIFAQINGGITPETASEAVKLLEDIGRVVDLSIPNEIISLPV